MFLSRYLFLIENLIYSRGLKLETCITPIIIIIKFAQYHKTNKNNSNNNNTTLSLGEYCPK